MYSEQGGGAQMFKDNVADSGMELKLARIEHKLDRLLAMLEDREGGEGGPAARQGIFEGIYDNIKYPVAFFLDSVASVRGQAPEEGAFTRL